MLSDVSWNSQLGRTFVLIRTAVQTICPRYAGAAWLAQVHKSFGVSSHAPGAPEGSWNDSSNINASEQALNCAIRTRNSVRDVGS
jgi:hypothetical protein